jgi:hypothetical protein
MLQIIHYDVLFCVVILKCLIIYSFLNVSYILFGIFILLYSVTPKNIFKLNLLNVRTTKYNCDMASMN